MLDLRNTLPITSSRDMAPRDISDKVRISPAESEVAALIPLSNVDYPVRLKYRNYHSHVRIGRLLEDFDSVAVATSYKHNQQLERANDS